MAVCSVGLCSVVAVWLMYCTVPCICKVSLDRAPSQLEQQSSSVDTHLVPVTLTDCANSRMVDYNHITHHSHITATSQSHHSLITASSQPHHHHHSLITASSQQPHHTLIENFNRQLANHWLAMSVVLVWTGSVSGSIHPSNPASVSPINHELLSVLWK